MILKFSGKKKKKKKNPLPKKGKSGQLYHRIAANNFCIGIFILISLKNRTTYIKFAPNHSTNHSSGRSRRTNHST